MPRPGKKPIAAVGIALAGVAVASLCGALARFGWPFELFAHFRWQLGAAGLVVLVAALLLRRPWMAVVAAVTVLLQWAPWASWGTAAQVPPTRACEVGGPGTPVTVANINLWFRNRDHPQVLQWLEANPADVVVLQEVTPAWAGSLGSIRQLYPHQKLLPRDDTYGIGILSRWPLDDVVAVDFANDGLPSLLALVDLPGRRAVRIVALHSHWPLLPRLQRSRDLVLVRAGALAHIASKPTLLVGDLNVTPFAPAFQQLLARSALQDAFGNQAWRPTWQAGFWPLALPLDHVLLPASGCVESAQVGPDVGSDHRPVLVKLRVR